MTKKLKRSYKEKHKKSVALKQIFALLFFRDKYKTSPAGLPGFSSFSPLRLLAAPPFVGFSGPTPTDTRLTGKVLDPP